MGFFSNECCKNRDKKIEKMEPEKPKTVEQKIIEKPTMEVRIDAEKEKTLRKIRKQAEKQKKKLGI